MPAEFRTTHVGKLRKALFGTRPVAASWGDELRKGLVCSLSLGSVSRCCCHNELCSFAGTVHGDDIFVAGPRQDMAKVGTTLKKKWETRDQMNGPKPGDQKELHILNRTLRWCKDGLVFAANLLKPLDEEGKRLYQRIVAKLNLSSARSTGLEVRNFMSGKCCLVA